MLANIKPGKPARLTGAITTPYISALIEAKRRCGEPTEDLSFPKFHRLIASKADTIKQQRGCDRVRFSVTVEDGHVSFKARADRKSE